MRRFAIVALAAAALAACQPAANQDTPSPADTVATEEPAVTAPQTAETAPATEPTATPAPSTPPPRRPRAEPAPTPAPAPAQTTPDHDMSDMPNMEHPPGQ
ncbi:MAG: hypothetical protein NW206_03375 [Hyphomonadaceae bacterium]|jgi:hypothetical protein|nr:hypothetical protein [Hyphomonadaceae bacterium]